MSLPLAILVSAGVSGVAWKAGTLSKSGALAAWSVGTVILCGTGWSGGAVLAVFFVSSSLISRLTASLSAPLLDQKGERRDAWQVVANGGPAALAALLPADAGLKLWLMTASLSAAAADTWATSLGSRSRVAPRLLLSGQSVTPGTSGGITPAGCLGALIGAMAVSGTGALAAGRPALFMTGTLIGFLGMMVDSLAGGLWQGRYHCLRCDLPSEWPVHRCGSRTEWRSGWTWFTNDVVNLFATALAVVAGWASWIWLD